MAWSEIRRSPRILPQDYFHGLRFVVVICVYARNVFLFSWVSGTKPFTKYCWRACLCVP